MKQKTQLTTIWGEKLNKKEVLPEYPREMLRRDDWICLNGYWEYAFVPAVGRQEDSGECPAPEKWDGRILVPFSPESFLSGVQRQLKPGEVLWYRRFLPDLSEQVREGKRVILHFGAVDQSCIIYINGSEACRHAGGYLSFETDITDFLKKNEGNDELCVYVRDDSDRSGMAHGKQRLKRGGMYYTATSGIWQTVWVETVPEDYIKNLEVHSEPDMGLVDLTVHSTDDVPVTIRVHAPDISVGTDIYQSDDQSIMQGVLFHGMSNHSIRMRIPNPHLWTCDAPWLYHFDVFMGKDSAESYFAFRTVAVRQDENGIPRIYLNGEPVYMKGVLDQGYWPDGMYTAPSDEAILFDLTEIKHAGFNMIRKHAKIEPDRWYYHCDRLGILVWQDIVNGGEIEERKISRALTVCSSRLGIRKPQEDFLDTKETDRRRKSFFREIDSTVAMLQNHPSVICWTLFNEGWGQFDAAGCTKYLRKKDPTRPIDSASGWFDRGCGDFKSIHYYYMKFQLRTEKKRAFIISEFGGLPMAVPGHTSFRHIFGYGVRYHDGKKITEAYEKLTKELEKYIPEGLCATVYTQWTDVEDEVNGIYTWDRKIKKIHPQNDKESLLTPES